MQRSNKMGGLFVFLGLALAACDEESPKEVDADRTEQDAGHNHEHADDAATDVRSDKPVYAMLWIVFGDEDSTGYIQLTDSLDAKPSLDEAREFGGWTSMTAVGGKLLVANDDTPRITGFTIGDDLTWGEGQTLNFANTGATNVNFGAIWLLDEHTGYLSVDTTSRVVFDPTELVIRETVEDSKLDLMRSGGLLLAPSWNRNMRLPVRDRIMIPYYYYAENSIPGPSVIATYDPDTHAETRLTEVNCEGLEVSSQDEAGNTYFSPWWSNQLAYLYGKVDPACVVRIKPDGTLDDGWPKTFLDVTDDRPISSWQYLKDGKAVASVLHKEEIEADFSGELDPDLELKPYYVWFFDVEKGEGHKIEGIDASGENFNIAVFGEQTYLLIADAEWKSSTAYLLDIETGTVEPAFKTEGWLVDWLRVK